MKNMWCTCLILFCFVLSIFCGNYTYYSGKIKILILENEPSFLSIGFAYNDGYQLMSNQTMDTCVCQCLLMSQCSGFTFYNETAQCSFFNDIIVTESEVSLNNTAILLLVTANLSTT